MENYIGRLLDNRYEILEAIGAGGMAVVYKALDHRLNRLVAVKILKDDFSRNQEFRRRFHAESQAVAMLSHPNIVSVYDVSRTGDIDYIVMELIEGITLKQYLERKGSLNWRETLHFSMQIAKALEHAHSRGIVHRDIKPHNIMILKDGSIKVADFGIARISSAQSTLTREALGSVHYISPEQAKGARVDCRSDLYSLGVVMYEMLTGRTPYDGETPVAVAIQHINGGARLPSELTTGIPLGLEQITMHAMNSNPEARYASATEMLRDMEEFRKNPAITFHFNSMAAPVQPRPQQPLQQPRTGMTRTDAERYAAARGAAKPDGRTPEERRAERARREKELAAEKRKRNLTIGIIAGAVLAVILAVVLIVVLTGGSDEPVDPLATSETQEDGNVIVNSFVGKKLIDLDPDDYPDLKLDFYNVKEEFSDEYEEGYIIEQNPRAGDEVRKGRTVTFTISKGSEGSDMPDFVNRASADAIQQLENLKLGLKVVTEEEGSDTVTKGYITRTEPAADTKLEKNQQVKLYVSLGSNKMPTLRNESKENAETRLKAMELNLKLVFLEEEDDEVEEGKVIRTSPAADSELTKGQQITLYISLGDGKVTVPQVLGFSKMEAIQLLRDANLGFEVKELYDETVEKGKVISQSELPNTKVKKDTVVTIDISLGPDPTKNTTAPTEAPTTPPTAAPTEPTAAPNP